MLLKMKGECTFVAWKCNKTVTSTTLPSYLDTESESSKN